MGSSKAPSTSPDALQPADVRERLIALKNNELLSDAAKRKIDTILSLTQGATIPKPILQTLGTLYTTIDAALNKEGGTATKEINKSLEKALREIQSGASLQDAMNTFSGKFEKFGDMCKKAMEVLENTLGNCSPETLDFLRNFFGGGTLGALIDMVKNSAKYRSFYLVGLIESIAGRTLEGVSPLDDAMRKAHPTLDDSQLNMMRSEQVLSICKPMLQPLQAQAKEIGRHPGRSDYNFEEHVAAVLGHSSFQKETSIAPNEIISIGQTMLQNEKKNNPIVTPTPPPATSAPTPKP